MWKICGHGCVKNVFFFDGVDKNQKIVLFFISSILSILSTFSILSTAGMFRFISAPPSTAQHRQLLRLRSNLTVYSSLSSHPASPRPCLHVSHTLLSLHFTLSEYKVDSGDTHCQPSCCMCEDSLELQTTWLSGCNGSTGSGLLHASLFPNITRGNIVAVRCSAE